MKYRFKINTPWGSRGQLVSMNPFYGFGGGTHFYQAPLDMFPDLFEPIEEKSDSDLLAEWIFWDYDDGAIEQARNLSAKLMSSKAINPEFLETLRKGKK